MTDLLASGCAFPLAKNITAMAKENYTINFALPQCCHFFTLLFAFNALKSMMLLN